VDRHDGEARYAASCRPCAALIADCDTIATMAVMRECSEDCQFTSLLVLELLKIVLYLFATVPTSLGVFSWSSVDKPSVAEDIASGVASLELTAVSFADSISQHQRQQRQQHSGRDVDAVPYHGSS
jgi:hypothetical protein